MKFKLEKYHRNVPDEDLLKDLRRVATVLENNTVPQKKYGEIGKYDCSTIIRRFGSWNKALIATGLEISNEILVSDERLFENLLALWQHLGRQPRRRDLTNEVSQFSQSPYRRRFGSWTAALEKFVNYANADDVQPSPEVLIGNPSTKRTPRDPSLRVRFKVLQRDGFSCRQCGASPAKTMGVELHVDHIEPYSKAARLF